MGGPELVLVILLTVVLLGVAVVLATRAREKTEVDALEVLSVVADRSGGHPACPGCRSLSFHPVPPRHQSAGGFFFWFFYFGSVYAGRPSGIIECTVCGRRFRQR